MHPYACAVVLEWFVSDSVASTALSGSLITEDQVEVRPQRIPTSCIDENVCIKRCRKYFTEDAWLAVMSTVAAVEKKPLWYCGICKEQLQNVCDGQSTVACDSCLIWFHFKCACIKQRPKSQFWFCKTCRSRHI